MKSRILTAEIDGITGLGLLPAGLFSFIGKICGENYCDANGKDA